MNKYIIGLSGASGSIYGIRLLEELLKRNKEIHLIISEPACQVIEQELHWNFDSGMEECFLKHLPAGNIKFYRNSDIAAPLASGSFITGGMVLIPCSMASISSISIGRGRNLMERCADVMLKEKRQLILVPRETPLSSIHLRNMLALSDLGVHIIPAMPAFYHHPRSIDDLVNFVVGKVMDAMHIEHDIFQRYK